MRNQPRILIVEDEPAIAELIAVNLRHNGMAPVWAEDGESAQREIDAVLPDAILLDWMLPGASGLQLARRWRADARTKGVPILMLTARGDVMDRVVGIELGADDYLPKPFEPRELLVRLQAILRRTRPVSLRLGVATVLSFDGLQIDLERREARRDGLAVELTSMEFELLALLAKMPGKVFSREEILEQLRGQSADDLVTRAVDILVSRLRKKLEPLDCIKTLRNAGYRFAAGRTGNRAP